MIDVHCHLNFHAFKDDYDTVISRAFDAGLTHIINVGTQIKSSKRAVELANMYDKLYAIVGIHPHHADKPEENWLEELEALAKHKKVLAIGEIGMDFYRYKSNGIVDPVAQKDIFIAQIQLAHKLGLPLQIHNRHAGKEIIEILKAYRLSLLTEPGMFHCFAGNTGILKEVLSLGFCVGFDGNSTYPGLAPHEDTSLTELARLTPLDRIVVETDSPFLTPLPYRGSRNEPQYAILIAKYLAQIKGVSFESLVAHTTENVERMFNFSKK